MRKISIVALCMIMCISLVACKSKDSGSINAQMPNPFIDCETFEDAEKIAGFDITIPKEIPKGYTQSAIRAVEDKMLEIIFKNGDDKLVIRKAKGNEDISGDYNEYAQTKAITVGSLQVTVKGNDEKVSVATWTDSDYSFAICTVGLAADSVLDMIADIN